MREFKNLSEFDTFLNNVIRKEKFHITAILEACLLYIENEAKRKFGVYQDQVGPFSYWPELAESTMQDRIRKGFEPDNPLYRTGELMNSIYHQVKGNVGAVGSDDPIMLWQEEGTEMDGKQHIPPRPVLGPAAFQSKAKLQKIIAQGLKFWLTDKPPIKKNLIRDNDV